MSIRLETLSQILPTGERSSEGKDAAAEAATGMEALFLRQMMAEMRRGQKGGLLDGGYAGSVFRQMMDESVADEMASAGGLGLASMLEAQLGSQGKNHAPLDVERTARRAYGVQASVTKAESDHAEKSVGGAKGSGNPVESKTEGGR